MLLLLHLPLEGEHLQEVARIETVLVRALGGSRRAGRSVLSAWEKRERKGGG